MARKISKSIEDRSIKEKIFCNRCNIVTDHKALSSVYESYETSNAYEEPSFYYDYSIIECGGCSRISFVKSYTHSEMVDYIDEFNERQVYEYTYYPEPLKTNKNVLDSRHIPKKLKEHYKETLSLLARKMNRFAGLGLRILIEELVKDRGAVANNLPEMIKKLYDDNIITSDENNILMNIKAFGDGAAHNNEIQSQEMLQDSIKVIELIMLRIFDFEKLKSKIPDSNKNEKWKV